MASSTVFTSPKLLNISRRWSAVTLRVRLLTCRIFGAPSPFPRRDPRSFAEPELELLRWWRSLSGTALSLPAAVLAAGEAERESE